MTRGAEREGGEETTKYWHKCLSVLSIVYIVYWWRQTSANLAIDQTDAPQNCSPVA